MRREHDNRPPLERLISIGCTDLTARAQAGSLARAYGRDAELEQMAHSLLQRKSILLQGPAEVGKTALIHELACRMLWKQGPEALHGKRIVAISTGGILAGTEYLGDWQTRLTDLLEAVKQADNLYLYIEDIWGIRDAGRASDKADGFATLIRPYLERQDLALIGETTPENFVSGPHRQRGLADEYSLLKCFNLIKLEEPSPEATGRILVAVSRHLQRTHQVRIEPGAIERGLELTRRFLPYRAFPGKAVRLLEETARSFAPGEPARVTVASPSGEVVIDADVISTGFSRMTGLPEKIISDRIPLTQDEIRAYFEERVVGQEDAISAVTSVVTLVKAELHDLNRPLGVLFFVGPTGVGKTEMAKTLAAYLFGSKDKLIRFDMSEYKTFTSLDDLLEQLTEKQRRQSFSVLLLDEIEKAGPWVFDLFLSAFDDARLTDSSGRSVDLRNTIVIMTSNLGSDAQPSRPPSSLGFVHGHEEAVDAAKELRDGFLHAVHAAFRPEFVNRLDKIVVFQPLGIEEMRRIARRELGRALIRPGRLGVTRRNILLDFREEVLDVLLREGFSPAYGARPLQRAIKELVLLPLAQRIAAQPSMGDQLLELGVKDGRIVAEAIPVGPTLAAVRPEASDDRPAERPGTRERAEAQQPARDARQVESRVAGLLARVEERIESERYRALQDRAQALTDQMGLPNFWDDQAHVRRTLSAAHRLRLVTDRFVELRNRAEGLCEKARMIRLHGDLAGVRELAEDCESLEREFTLAELEIAASDAGDAEEGACIRITALTMPRTGDATEWVRALAEMYMAWAERKGYEVGSLLAEDAPGLLLVRGANVARILAGESGIHKRQTERAASNGGKAARAQVQLARVEVLPLPPGADASDGTADGLDSREEADGATAEAHTYPPQVRGANMEADETLVRIYYQARSQHVRDPRTGHRVGRAREVLHGAIDDFLFAYLKRERRDPADGTGEPAVAPTAETMAKKTGRPARTAATRTIGGPSARDTETPPAS